MFKKYAIVPLEGEKLQFQGMSFECQNLDDVLVIRVPDVTPHEEVVDLRDKLVVAFPDKTVIVMAESINFCKIREVGAEE